MRLASSPRRGVLFFLSLLLLTASCGGDDRAPTRPSETDDGDDDAPPAVASIDVSPDSAVLDSVGDTADFDATARDASGGTVEGVTFAWSSSDTTVATVDESGTATARAAGTAVVVAAAEGVEGEAAVRIRDERLADRPDFLLRSFKGLEGVHHPPDHDIAAGPTRLVAVSNESTVLLTKDGTTLDESDGHEMFAPLRREGEGAFDPRVAYDPDSGRFFVLYTAVDHSNFPCDPGTCVNHVYLAVSRSASPASLPPDGWHLYDLDMTVDGDSATSNTADFPRIGVGADALYLVTIQVPSDRDQVAGNVYNKIRILDKAKLVAGEPVDWTDLTHLEDPVTGGVGQLQMQPVVRQPGGGMYFVGLPHQSTSCDLGVFQVRSPLSSPTIEGTVAVAEGAPGPNVSCRHPTDALQPDDAPRLATLRPVAQPTEVVYAGGSLWLAHHVRIEDPEGDRGGIRWAELDVGPGPTATFRQDTVFQADGAWLFFPAIMADEEGNMGMVYGRSSATEYASLYFVHRRSGDPPNRLRDPVLLRAGATSLRTTEENYIPETSIRYADFFGMSRDPSDGSWWMLGEYVIGPDRWGGWVANVAF